MNDMIYRQAIRSLESEMIRLFLGDIEYYRALLEIARKENDELMKDFIETLEQFRLKKQAMEIHEFKKGEKTITVNAVSTGGVEFYIQSENKLAFFDLSPDEAAEITDFFERKVFYSDKDYVVINGLKWDKKNTIVDDKEHFNFYEALGVAQVNGKRLPTKEEFEALIALGSTWDDEHKGMWSGYDHKFKSGSKRSVFFPADGLYFPSENEVLSKDKFGYYWIGDNENPKMYTLGTVNHFRLRDAFMNTPFLSVRCVSE
jgi:hypothetical protein